jgi:hypothetical protein
MGRVDMLCPPPYHRAVKGEDEQAGDRVHQRRLDPVPVR